MLTTPHSYLDFTKIVFHIFSFIPESSTMEAIYLLRRLMKRYRDTKKDLHMVFIDLEKASDKIPRDLIWWALEKKGATIRYIEII